jgi:hypothetical protein
MNAPALFLAVSVAILPAAAKPSAAPSPAPSDKPLLEIGRVHATTPFCRGMIEQATAAVDVALSADRQIQFTSGMLRKVDLDSSQIAKYHGTEDLRKRYVALRATAVDGERRLKAFKDDLKAAPSDDQRAALEKFADALAGAIHRQKKIAEDLGRYLAFLDASDPLTEDERDEAQRKILENASNPYAPHDPFGDINMVPETLSHSARGAAEELDVRASFIGKDEDDAASRIDAAFNRC